MRNIVAGHLAADESEFAELALGIDTELFTGPANGESGPERTARLAAARDILEDLRRTDVELATYAAKLLSGDRITIHWPPAVPAGSLPRTGKAGHLAARRRVAA